MLAKSIRFNSYDGLQLTGDIVSPDRPRALGLLIHGIQSYRDEYGFYSDMAESLAQIGCSTLRFDWRCHYFDSPVELVKDLTLAGLYNDIDSAAKALIKEAVPNSQHPPIPLIVIGASFGGGVGAFWAQRNPTRVKHVVLCAPVLDYERDYLIDTGLMVDGVLTEAAIRSLESDGYVRTCGRPFSRALVNELRLFNPGKHSPIPITIIHGDCDKAEPHSYSEEFTRSGSNVSLITIPGADHGFAEPGDNDLNWPQTKANHHTVYSKIADLIKKVA